MESQSVVLHRDEAKGEALGVAFVDAAQRRNWTRVVIHEHEAAAHEQIDVWRNPRMLRVVGRYSGRNS
jgi:Fe-S cluster assembly scaffold protein SufB